MALKSMTGFASGDGALGNTSWRWEARSVNGRGLDVRVRLAPGYDGLEPRVRDAVARHVLRGSVQISLAVRREDGPAEIRLNEHALAQVIEAARRARELAGGEPARLEALLSLKGVLELVEPEEPAQAAAARAAAMLATLDDALEGVVAARASEGERLRVVVLAQVDAIERLIAAIVASPARTPAAIRQRLKEQVARLLECGPGLDETRLYQEAALLATRADIEEELKRLGIHIAAARELIEVGQGTGRKLDFLAQELNREANTLCSKSGDSEIAKHGLALKAVIDQVREQVQNIE